MHVQARRTLPRLATLVALAALVGAAAACRHDPSASRPTDRDQPTSDARRVPLVFVPGIKGTTLQTRDGDVQWITATQALDLSTPSLALPTRYVDGKQPHDALVAGPVLAEVRVLPPFLSVDLYGPWLEAAAGFGRALRPFAYDWRRGNDESAARLTAFLEKLARAQPGGKVDVVAHSMGGLIALSALNAHPELFNRVVFVGVPFAGGIGFLPHLHVGVPTALNAEIAGRAVTATWPSVFSLFPMEQGRLREKDGAAVPVDFYDPKDWERLRLGMFAEATPSAGYRRFFAEAVRRAKAFRESLEPRRGAAYPPVLAVRGTSHPTLDAAVRNGPRSDAGWDFHSAPKVQGDGLVAYATATPPNGLPYRSLQTNAEHTYLLNDPDVIEAIRGFLAAGDARDVADVREPGP
jgi:pimeloyl-ACP methyl ester carboxylesterase